MVEQYNFNDIIKNSFLNLDSFIELSIVQIIVALLFSLLLGVFIYVVYKKTYKGVVYSHNFNITLVLMTMITSLIIMTISTNIVLSLGMVGALSIVRFRTAIKDPLDIVFMFWAIAIGIACGAGLFLLSLISSVLIAGVIYFLSRKKFKETVFLLVIHYEEHADSNVKMSMKNLSYVLKSKIIRNKMIELTVEVKLKIDNTAFVNHISEVKGVKDVSLVHYNGDYAT
ncbi:DUF4956 domain-containing protein [Bacillus sp. Marseille-P3661]|uniref:DUF4956 domain-containing protein n=1 Tax=Bacillus sp. Marseille-P3661 TaxID=1936234 RepID=UPI000C855B5C|nr:DUF4956 domain-containing protein [Bacillus sp. Marseille-P3661]